MDLTTVTKIPFFRSMRGRLSTLLVLVALLPLVAITVFNYLRASNALKNAAIRETEAFTTIAEGEIQTFLSQFAADVLSLSQTPPIQGIIRARDNNGIDPVDNDTYEVWVNRLNTIFTPIAETKQYYQQMRYLNENGDEMVRVDYDSSQAVVITGDALQNKADREYFIDAMELQLGAVYISELNLNRERGEIQVPYVPVIRFATPVFDSDGQPRGIVILNVYANFFLELLEDESSDLYLVNEQGYYLHHTNEEYEFGFELGTDYNAFRDFAWGFEQFDLQDEDIVTDINPNTGSVLSLQQVHFDPNRPDRYWMLIKQLHSSEVLDEASNLRAVSILAVLVTGGLIALMGMGLAGTITNPIQTLVVTSQQVAAGNLNITAEVEREDEVSLLALSFNEMIDRLRVILRNEQQQRERLQTTVKEYVTHMTRIGQGDLTARLTFNGDERDTDDPLVVLGRNLNETTVNLHGMIARIREAANNLNAGASAILAATTQQSTGASEQSAAISQVTTTVDEVKAISEQSISWAQEVAEASQQTVNVSRSGRLAVRETVTSMSHIKERVEGIAENIVALSGQTQQIGAIISTVNEIAAQSNMLALNASVEAARAGEHGKGFAVVAVEVRNLANQSRQATEQVRAILSDIQKAINTAVMVTEEGTRSVDAGVSLASQAGEVIEQLSEVINRSAQAAGQMAAGGEQQAAGVNQIALALQSINQATVQSLSSTKQTETTAKDLNQLARTLTKAVEQYQLVSINGANKA